MADTEKRLTDEPTPIYESYDVKLKLVNDDGQESILSFPTTSAKATEENIQALADSITDPENETNFIADSNGKALVALVEAYTLLTQRWQIETGGE